MRPQFESPSWPLQQAVLARLTTHSEMVTPGYDKIVFDFVKDNMEKPYIRLGTDFLGEWGARDISGSVITYPVDIFTDTKEYVGKKECKVISNAVCKAISASKINLAVHGFSVVVQIFSGQRILEEGEGSEVIYHGIVEFTYKIQSI